MAKQLSVRTDAGMARLRGRRWTADEARQVLAAWEASGTSMAAFARRHGVTAQRIAWWRERLAGVAKRSSKRETAQASVRFIPALVRESATSHGAALTIRLRSDIELEVADPARVPVEWLAALIETCEETAP